MIRFMRLTVLAALLVTTFWATIIPSSASASFFPSEQCQPATAGYGCNVYVSTLGYFKGWANVVDSYVCQGYPPSPAAEDARSKPLDAWSWSSVYGWRYTTVPRSTRVYVWPYATGWSWVWTQDRGWLAMRDDVLVVNQWHGTCWAM